jgi:hypothetical protein
MNFFEQELRKLFAKNHAFDDVKSIGKACYGTLGEKTRMKLEFVTLGTYQKYEGIKATIIDKTDGIIDTLTLKFSDIWGKKELNHPNFRVGIEPYIWIYNEKTEWYAYEPTNTDYKVMAESVKEYAELFKEQAQEMKNSYSLNQQM